MTADRRYDHAIGTGYSQPFGKTPVNFDLRSRIVLSEIGQQCRRIGMNRRQFKRPAALCEIADQSLIVEVCCRGTYTADQTNMHGWLLGNRVVQSKNGLRG